MVSGRNWILVARNGLTDVVPVANRCQFATVSATVGTGFSRPKVFPHTATTPLQEVLGKFSGLQALS